MGVNNCFASVFILLSTVGLLVLIVNCSYIYITGSCFLWVLLWNCLKEQPVNSSSRRNIPELRLLHRSRFWHPHGPLHAFRLPPLLLQEQMCLYPCIFIRWDNQWEFIVWVYSFCGLFHIYWISCSFVLGIR